MSISLIVLQGPSAAGKSTIQSFLEVPRIVTWTSRPPRVDEVDKLDYYFKTKSEMENIFNQGEMFEMTEYHNNYYGTPLGIIRDCIEGSELKSLILDANGSRKIKKMFSNKVLIIGVKACKKDCERRLLSRNIGQGEVETRLKTFNEEIEALSHCDLIINNNNENQNIVKNIIELLKQGWVSEHGVL